MNVEELHVRARDRGVDRRLYRLVRMLLTPPLRLWFRMRVSGAEHIPEHGPAIVACNHKSFLDPFFLGLSTRRHVRFMAKTELLKGPLGRLLVRLGAFPVRRGESDAEAMRTAETILAQGGIVVIFPEGTRVEEADALGAPHHGAGRLALQTGVPIVPAAISGTQHLWLGPVPKPRRVQLTFMPPIDPAELAGRPDALTAIVDERMWGTVRQEYGRQLARPGMVLAGLAALGLGAGLLARRQVRSVPRLLGTVQPRKLRRRQARRRLLDRATSPARRLLARMRRRSR